MLILLLLILGTALVLAGLFTAGSLFLQAYVYSQPVEGILWRGPVAGVAVGLFVGIWLLLARGAADGRYQTLLQYSPRDSSQFDELILVGRDGSKLVYKGVREGNRVEYRLNGRPGTENRWPTRPATIFARENGEEVEFKPDRDDKGRFKTAENQPLAYRDARGRVMTEDFPGQINIYRWGQFFAVLFLNFGLFVVMLAVLWLLLEYHFWHAFGLSIVLWAAFLLFVMPPLLSYAEWLKV